MGKSSLNPDQRPLKIRVAEVDSMRGIDNLSKEFKTSVKRMEIMIISTPLELMDLIFPSFMVISPSISFMTMIGG